jgi:hypothetical protein
VFTQSIAEQVDQQQVQYLWVDSRLSKLLPASGEYFPGNDPKTGHYYHPIPLGDLTKYNGLPGVARLYDGGDIVIYGLAGVATVGLGSYEK